MFRIQGSGFYGCGWKGLRPGVGPGGDFVPDRLKSDMNRFVSFLGRAARSDEKIKREHIKFVELDKMAEYANKMLADRALSVEALKRSE